MTCDYCGCDCQTYEPTPEEVAEYERRIAEAAERREIERWSPARDEGEQVMREMDRCVQMVGLSVQLAMYGNHRSQCGVCGGALKLRATGEVFCPCGAL